VETVGKELGAQYVLEGSVRRDADRVRVNAELIQAKDQRRLWAREYDRQLSSLLTLQGEIAQEIADEIEVALGKPQGSQSIRHPDTAPESYEAYDFYLQGRYFWNKRTEKGLEQASQSFQQAIARDPSFARAYAGLADSYALTGAYGILPPDEIMPKARNAALTALRLNEGLAEAHASLAVIAQNYDWDWESAEKEYRRAIQLDPNYATAHHWYAEYLALQGRFDESSVEFARARKLDPLSLIIATDNAVMLYLSRQYDRAIEQFRVVQSMEPEFPRVHTLASAYAAKGAYKEALADIATWQSAGGENWAIAESGYVYALAGRREEALKVLELLRRRDHQKPLNPLLFATVYTGLGDKENAIAMLGKACDAHSASLTALGVDPMFDGLRGDAKFQDLLRRLHLAR
jgi:Tfp pilus assembly protein PilF